MGYDIDPRGFAEDLYGTLIDVTHTDEPPEEYEKYEEAVKSLGFEGIGALEAIVGRLMDSARMTVLEGKGAKAR
jgi:hypothetical protein